MAGATFAVGALRRLGEPNWGERVIVDSELDTFGEVGIELNPEYVNLARHRITDDAPLLNHETTNIEREEQQELIS